MNPSERIAKHYLEVHFGGNWTSVHLKGLLEDVNWKEATCQVSSFNTIAGLFYHIQYFTEAIIPVLEGKPLESHDKYSYDVPEIASEQDWQSLKAKVWDRAKALAELISSIPIETLDQPFFDPKYGTHYRNFHGLIEHTHYHLGQIALIRKHLKEHPELVLS